MDAVVFVYDVNNIETLMALDSWVDEVEEHGVGQDLPRVLVGNKLDEAEAGTEDVVTTNTAQRWADDRSVLWGNIALNSKLSDVSISGTCPCLRRAPRMTACVTMWTGSS